MKLYSQFKKTTSLNWFEGITSLFYKSEILFDSIMKECDLYLYEKLWGSGSSGLGAFGPSQIVLVLVPHSDEVFNLFSENWHEELSKFCSQRNQIWTEEESEIHRKISALRVSLDLDGQSFELFWSSGDMTPKKRSLEDIQADIDLLEAQLSTCEKSGLFPETFDRTIDDQFLEKDTDINPSFMFPSLSPLLRLEKELDPEYFDVYEVAYNEKKDKFMIKLIQKYKG